VKLSLSHSYSTGAGKRVKRKGPGHRAFAGNARHEASPESTSQKHGALPSELPLVEVDVEADPSPHWIRELSQRWRLRVRLDLCRPMASRSSDLMQVVELIGDPGDLDAAERFLRRRKDIRTLTILPLSPSRRFVRAVSPMPESCRPIFEVGAICAKCQFSSAARTSDQNRWTLVVPRTTDTLRIVARGRPGREGTIRSFLRMRRFVPARTLTPRQTTALETAYRLGFYAFPRRTNLREISRILGVSRATTAELLRRAESKILSYEIGGS